MCLMFQCFLNDISKLRIEHIETRIIAFGFPEREVNGLCLAAAQLKLDRIGGLEDHRECQNSWLVGAL